MYQRLRVARFVLRISTLIAAYVTCRCVADHLNISFRPFDIGTHFGVAGGERPSNVQ
jgi:hypothetical protein